MPALVETVCPVCGAKNAPHHERCSACGARIEHLGAAEFTAEEEEGRQYQQDAFEGKWAFIAFFIYFAMQAVVLAFLPLVILTYDPQGLPGLAISAAVWFVG